MRAWAYAILFLSVLIYRNGHVFKNIILTKRDFPVGYYYAGDFDRDCSSFQVEALKNCEDAAFWDVHDGKNVLVERHLILSCDPGRKAWNTVMGPLHNPEPHGGLWLYTSYSSRSKDTAVPRRIAIADYPQGHDFHPLGLDIWPSRDGSESNLYVINHARQRTVIEHFVLNPSEPTVARHIRTISSPFFLSPNSVALTSPDAFYVSNDHLMTRRLPIVGHVLPVIESILSLPLGFVLHVTLSSSSQPIIVPSSLFIPFPNGLALSPDGKILALASSSLAQIRFYARDPATNELTRRIHTVDVPFAADNIRFADDGTLLVAGHPHFPTLIKVAANKTEHAPSWAAAIPPLPLDKRVQLAPEFDLDAPTSMKGLVAGVPEMKTVFQSDGQGFSAASTTLRDDKSGALYVTGLYTDQGFLVCRPRA